MSLLAFLRRPKTAAQLLAEFGHGTLARMREHSNRGEVIMAAPHWTKTGWRWLYYAAPTGKDPYLTRRLAALGADLEREVIV